MIVFADLSVSAAMDVLSEVKASGDGTLTINPNPERNDGLSSDMSADLHYLSIAEAARLIEARKLSPVEYADALIHRIEALEPQVNAFITFTADLARWQSKQAEEEIAAGRYRGPLHGIPFALKDIYNTRGTLTSGGSRVCIDNIPQEDATTTRKLLEAGAVLLGKLVTHEFAHGGPSFDLPWPPARNPWNLAHFTGGSSSGSGAALAAGLVPASLGSDTGGSIRGPSSFCGTTGLMPTYGLVSRAGVIPNSFTFDHCGPMARTVEDCAILLQAIAGFDPLDAGSIDHNVPDYRAALAGDIKGLRIGVLRHYWEEDLPVPPDQRRAMEEAIAVFRSLGAKVENARARPMMDGMDVKIIIAESEIFSIHHSELMRRPGDFGRDFLGRVLPACLFTSADYVQALREHRRYMADMKPLHEKYDVLLTAGFGAAPRLDAHKTVSFWQRSNIFTPSNVARTPALVLCGGFSETDLPLGLQIIGRPCDDARVMKVGHAYQLATNWHRRRPSLQAGAPQPVLQPGNEPVRPDLDAATVSHVEQMARRAGLNLDERQMSMLLETAPYALAMAERMRKPRDRMEEPSLVFRFAGKGIQ
jgi:aspartyl-tRNA(Asn)/glutamyl-tRNA(Gln) amidotransferase subunit A